jgi:hypothetical protein
LRALPSSIRTARGWLRNGEPPRLARRRSLGAVPGAALHRACKGR